MTTHTNIRLGRHETEAKGAIHAARLASEQAATTKAAKNIMAVGTDVDVNIYQEWVLPGVILGHRHSKHYGLIYHVRFRHMDGKDREMQLLAVKVKRSK